MTRTEDALKELRLWARRTGIALTEEHIGQLRCYLDTLLLWNRKVSLVSQTDPGTIIAKHLADSVFAATICNARERLADLGSGAGFPGLPIAILRPKATVWVIESRAKRASFLSEAIRSASLTNAQLYHGRIETAAASLRHHGRYTLVISRALSALPEFLALARPLLHSNGRAVAMKSARYESELAAAHRQESALRIADVIPYVLPDNSERVLLVFRFAAEQS